MKLKVIGGLGLNKMRLDELEFYDEESKCVCCGKLLMSPGLYYTKDGHYYIMDLSEDVNDRNVIIYNL
jgi:hypothetical protein